MAMAREDIVVPTLSCFTCSPGVRSAAPGCSMGPQNVGHLLLTRWFAFPYLNTSVFTISLLTGLAVQPCWQAACYLPVPLCKLKTSHDILTDDIISLALGKPLEKENGLNQKCLIEIAIFGKRGAGVLLV